jgi:hypothetical protein
MIAVAQVQVNTPEKIKGPLDYIREKVVTLLNEV